MQDVDLTAKDGTKLHSWMMWPRGWSSQKRRSRPTVLFFQACVQTTTSKAHAHNPMYAFDLSKYHLDGLFPQLIGIAL